MDEPKGNTVTFKQGNRLLCEVERDVTFVASRPGVLACLKNVEISQTWRGWCLTFRGTEAELIAAGIATVETFQGVGAHVGAQLKRQDEFDNDITVYRRRGSWILELRTDSEGSGCPPSDEQPRKCSWWIKHGGKAEAATAKILKRFARPAPRVRT